ncbi:MAG TPA: sulfotransferase [Nevskiaceae bacterium]|nr:sulfotransferase [Nevskiaceae bacterium]
MKSLFVGLGFQKCATTWLSMRLRRHPHVWAPPINELRFWDNYESGSARLPLQRRLLENLANRLLEAPDRDAAIDAADRVGYWLRYQRTSPDGFASYEALFAPGPQHRIAGEITPGYASLSTDTLRLIRSGSEGVKILLLMREPIARIWSQIRHEARLRPEEVKNQRRMLEYLESDRMKTHTNYHGVLQRVFEVFPPEQVGVFFFEDMLADQEAYLASICSFLGVDYDAAMLGGNKKDKSADKEKMPDVVRARAVELYGHVAGEVEKIIGSVPPSWQRRG